MAKALLDRLGVTYRSIDVGIDREAAEKMVALSGQYGVPVITVGSEVIIGFDAPRIEEIFGKERAGVTVDILIAGAGPAGLTAAVYAARKMMQTVVISENIGGQALESWSIENYMGYRLVTGDDLMKKFEDQVRSQNVRLELDRVDEVRREGDRFQVRTAAGGEFSARAVILAQGKRPRLLGVPGEDTFLGRGFSLCSTCDGPLFRDKIVAVVGGGNSALQTAIEMSRIAREVHLVVRSTIRADDVYVQQIKERRNVTIHSPAVVTGLFGSSVLERVAVENRETGTAVELRVDGVFAEIGWIPNTAFIKGLIPLNDSGEIIVDENCCTAVPGIFSAGDVTSVTGKQIIIAAGEGAKAALSAHEYLLRNPS